MFNKQRLTEYIERSDKSQAAIERLAGLQHGQLSKYKLGEYAPKPTRLINILVALSCPLEYERLVDWYTGSNDN